MSCTLLGDIVPHHERTTSMARRLETFPAATGARYPWDEWLDGSVWERVRGSDLSRSASACCGSNRVMTGTRGISLRNATTGGACLSRKDLQIRGFLNPGSSGEAPANDRLSVPSDLPRKQ